MQCCLHIVCRLIPLSFSFFLLAMNHDKIQHARLQKVLCVLGKRQAHWQISGCLCCESFAHFRIIATYIIPIDIVTTHALQTHVRLKGLGLNRQTSNTDHLNGVSRCNVAPFSPNTVRPFSSSVSVYAHSAILNSA
jgi:hypothetical protein